MLARDSSEWIALKCKTGASFCEFCEIYTHTHLHKRRKIWRKIARKHTPETRGIAFDLNRAWPFVTRHNRLSLCVCKLYLTNKSIPTVFESFRLMRFIIEICIHFSFAFFNITFPHKLFKCACFWCSFDISNAPQCNEYICVCVCKQEYACILGRASSEHFDLIRFWFSIENINRIHSQLKQFIELRKP